MLPAWFMQTIQAAELMALVKAEAAREGEIADHRPVQILNTLAKVGDKAVLEQCQAEYVREMMPQQVGLGVEFAAELLAMGLKMVLHLRGGFILINIDIVNAYNEIKRVSVVDAHMRRTHFVKWVPKLEV